MFKQEFKRALNWKLVIILFLITLIMHAYEPFIKIKNYMIELDYETLVQFGVLNTFSLWTDSNIIYTKFMPILVSLIYGTCFLQDIKSGFIKFIDCRVSHKKYQISKFFVNGIIGGLTICIPSIVFFLLLSIFVGGDIAGSQGAAVGGIFNDLLYSNSYQYMALFFFLEFAFGFAYSTISLGVSTLIKNEIVVILSPTIFYSITSYLGHLFRVPKLFLTSITTEFWILAENVTLGHILGQLMLITLIFGSIFFWFSRKDFINA